MNKLANISFFESLGNSGFGAISDVSVFNKRMWVINVNLSKLFNEDIFWGDSNGFFDNYVLPHIKDSKKARSDFGFLWFRDLQDPVKQEALMREANASEQDINDYKRDINKAVKFYADHMLDKFKGSRTVKGVSPEVKAALLPSGRKAGFYRNID